MDPDEQQVQRMGYAAAFMEPEVVAAIQSGYYRRIAVTLVEWGGEAFQEVTIPWRLISDETSAHQLSQDIAATPFQRFRWTSISTAIDFSVKQFGTGGFQGERQVIDVSGDGANNNGGPVEPARERALARGIVINGLPIMVKTGIDYFGYSNVQLDEYYRDCVIVRPRRLHGSGDLDREDGDRHSDQARPRDRRPPLPPPPGGRLGARRQDGLHGR